MSYSVVKIHGDSDINYVWGKNGTLSDTMITDITQNSVSSPLWDKDTFMLATFEEDLSASCFSQNKVIVGYKIKKKKVQENKIYNIVDIDTSSYSANKIYDYNIQNKSDYQYYIFPIFQDNGIKIVGEPLVTDIIHTNWSGWSIIGLNLTDKENVYEVDENNIWNFWLNVSEEPISPQFNKVFDDGFGQFPKVYVGYKNYLEGGLSALLGNVSCSKENGDYLDYIEDDITKIEHWRAFCHSACLKLLKDRRGRVIPVEIVDTTYTNVENITKDVTTISFNFKQVADAKNISVYGLEVV